MNSFEVPKFNSSFNKENERILPEFKIDLPKIEFTDEEYDNNCMQVSMAMVLKDLDKNYLPNLKQLNEVSHKEKGKGTWPGWTLSWLKKQNYSPEIYSKFDWKRFADEGEKYLNSEEFKNKHETEKPEELKKYIEKLGIQQGIKSTQEMVKNEIPINLIEEGVRPEVVLKNVFERIKNGARTIFLLDGDHWTPITGFDGENIYDNNPAKEGTEANRKKELKRFIEKWSKYNANTVIVIEKRFSH